MQWSSYCWAASLRAGNAIVIKEKFSASDFWSDIQKYEATIFPYVGELCRYLLNSKEVPEEKGHKIRRISGNGLRLIFGKNSKKDFRF